MSEKGVVSRSSRTAAWLCMMRAISNMESNSYYHSDDDIAGRLLPWGIRLLAGTSPGRMFLSRVLPARGMYEYAVARTRYLDEVYRSAMQQSFDQVLLLGAGFDTRAIRMRHLSPHTKVFELDAPTTQQAKLEQYRRRGVMVPDNVFFISLDMEKRSLAETLEQAGFEKGRRTLFLLEGLLMYLQKEAVNETFHVLQQFAGAGSLVAFDYVRAAILQGEDTMYGGKEASKMVMRGDEPWHSGFDAGEIEPFLAGYGFSLFDHKDATQLEEEYFTAEDGRKITQINDSHCLVTALKSQA